MKSAEGQLQTVFAFTGAKGSDARFLRFIMRPTGGEVKQAAVAGTNLHIFFRDGTHYRLRPPRLAMDSDPNEKNDFPELRLPDGRVPLVLTGDTQGTLYAIVPVTTAQRIIKAAEEAKQSDSPKDSASDSALSDANSNALPSKPSIDLGEAKYALVRYPGGEWSVIAPTPPAFDAHAEAWLIVADDSVQLIYVTESAPDALMVARCVDDAWQAPTRIPDIDPKTVAAALVVDKVPVIVVREPTSGASQFGLRPTFFRDQKWQQGEPLQWASQPLQVKLDTFDVSELSDSLLAIWVAPAEEGTEPKVHAARWPVTGGKALGEVAEVHTLASVADSAVGDRMQMLLTVVIMTLMLVLVLVRRRESFTTDLPVPDGFVLGRLGPRAIAFMIDLFLVGLIAYPLVLYPWMVENGIRLNGANDQQFAYAWAQDKDGAFWRWLIGSGLFALYGIIFESTLGATPGKLAMRLRVFDSSTKRPTLAAIVIRNLLRFEIYPFFQFAPIMVLVALTRNHQRLGDLVANTIVAEKA